MERRNRGAIMRTMWRACMLMVLPLILGGCYTSAKLGVVDQRKFLFVDRNGKREEFRLVVVETEVMALVVPMAPMGRKMMLVRDVPPDGFGEPLATLHRLPPWQRINDGDDGNLWATVHAMMRDEPTDRLQWILSSDPVVVAIGGPYAADVTQPQEPCYLGDQIVIGGPVQLVTDADSDQIVTKLVWLDRWPNLRFETDPLPTPKHTLTLAPGTTIGQAMREHRWLTPRLQNPH